MKQEAKWISMAFLGLCTLILLSLSVLTIREGQHAIVLRLGRLVLDHHTHAVKIWGPGLHFKIPMIETIRVFDTRMQTLDIKSSRIVTREKKDVIVDYYVKWKIEDLSRYFKATGGNQFKADTLLEQQLNTSLRAEFGRRTISELVSGGRNDLTEILRSHAETQAAELGVHVVDIRIKGIELPANTSNAIYQRMRADMQKIANRHRADGHAEAEAIQAGADAKVTVLLAKARREGEMMRAHGQAKAAQVYAQAYGQDAEFFVFYRSLKAYVQSFSTKHNVLVLDENSAFFKFFKNGASKASMPNG